MSQDQPTDEMPGGPEDPTELNPAGEEPTRVDSAGEEPTRPNQPGEQRTSASSPETAAPTEGGGLGVLFAAIIASLLLVAAYIVAGGPVAPDKAADPCDARPWTNPGNVEEAAQQFALSAADGAACELGVSREELTRSIAADETRQAFLDEHDLSESDLEDALRAGLNRAVDDAENAGALSGLAATGIRAAIRLMPMSVMIGLLEDADSIFNGDIGALGGLGDAVDAVTGGMDELGSGSADDPLNGLGDALEQALPEGTTDALEGVVPEETRRQLEEEAKKQLEQGLDSVFGP